MSRSLAMHCPQGPRWIAHHCSPRASSKRCFSGRRDLHGPHVYTHIYIYIDINMLYIFIYTHIPLCLYTYTYISLYTYIYICICVWHMYVDAYMYVCMYVCMYVPVVVNPKPFQLPAGSCLASCTSALHLRLLSRA